MEQNTKTSVTPVALADNQVMVKIEGVDTIVNTWKGIQPFRYKNNDDIIEWKDGRKYRYKSRTLRDTEFVMIDQIPCQIGGTEEIFQPELSIGHPDSIVAPLLWAAPDGQTYVAFEWFDLDRDTKTGRIKDIVFQGKLEIPGRISNMLLKANNMDSDDGNKMGAILAQHGCQLILTGNSIRTKKKEDHDDDNEKDDKSPIQRVRNLIKSRPETSVS